MKEVPGVWFMEWNSSYGNSELRIYIDDEEKYEAFKVANENTNLA